MCSHALGNQVSTSPKFVLRDAKDCHRLSNANSSDFTMSQLWRLLSSKIKNQNGHKNSLVQHTVINQCKLCALLFGPVKVMIEKTQFKLIVTLLGCIFPRFGPIARFLLRVLIGLFGYIDYMRLFVNTGLGSVTTKKCTLKIKQSKPEGEQATPWTGTGKFPQGSAFALFGQRTVHRDTKTILKPRLVCPYK